MQTSKFITVKDHSVSGESFDLVFNEQLDILKTEPQPSPERLGSYYESDDYISHTDASRTIFEKAYHAVRNIALRQKLSLISKYKSKGDLLDIGAGTGLFLEVASKSGWKTLGVEPSEKARTIAANRSVEVYSETTELGARTFDVITMWHVLEHVPDVELQIATLKKLLKPDGVIFIAVPNFKSLDAKIYGEHWAAYDVPRHLWHFSKSGISRLFSNAGMKVLSVEPMKFDAFYVSLLSEKIRSGKMNYPRAIINGIKSNLFGKRTGEYSSHIYIITNKE